MLIHWHTEAPADHLVTGFVRACLRELSRASSPSGPNFIQSWGDPAGAVEYRQHPENRSGRSESWIALVREAQPAFCLVALPSGSTEVELFRASADDYPGVPQGGWSWLHGSPDEERLADAAALLHPVLERGEGLGSGDPLQVGVLANWADPEERERWTCVARAVRRELPMLRFRALSEASAWPAALTSDLNGVGAGAYPRLCSVEPHECGAVIVAGIGVEWTPSVLQCLEAGRQVLAPQDSAAAAYLQEGRGDLWEAPADDASSILRILAAAHADPEERTARARRARVWARRRSLPREAQRLQELGEAASRSGPDGARPSPTRWLLRRETGIGDIVFTLTVAAALKQQDPTCEVVLHTARQHREWTGWFPFVDQVISGDFVPSPGVRVGDFEREFPGDARTDRTLALGALVGIRPEAWCPAPEIPVEISEEVRSLLGTSARPRIAFVPAARGHSGVRSLPHRVAREAAVQLLEAGEVLWLDETPVHEGLPEGVVDLTGRLTIGQAFALLSLCDLCVSVDSGLLHLAATLRKPVVGLFTHIAALQRLWLAERFVALQPSLPCAPCGEGPDAWHCQRGRIPAWAASLPCVALLQPEAIVSAARTALASDTRQVRLVGLDGASMEWDVDELPTPWST